jgi:dTDP-4-amino-4,6-dideoxygalactose transaminase
MLYHDYGIKTVPHYLPVYLFSLFKEMGYRPGECPVAEKVYLRLTNPPFNVLVSDEDVDYMIASFKETVVRLKKGERVKQVN